MSFKDFYNSLYTIKTDKLLHFIAGIILSLFLTKVFSYIKLPVLIAKLVTFCVVWLIAAVKELFDKSKGGQFSAPDLWSTVLGSFIALILS